LNVPYTRTPCVTESSGTGTIDGNITVFHNHVIKFHGDLTYNTTGPDRSVTKGTARTVWNKNGTSLTATSSLQSTTTEITGGGWQANNSFEFIGGNWTQTGTNLTKTVVYDRTLQASGSSGLTTVGGCLSLSMSGNEHLKLALPHFWLTRKF
jgi:hypothetical protein